MSSPASKLPKADSPDDTKCHEHKATTDWSRLLADSPESVATATPLGGPFPEAFDVRGIFSDAECAELVAAAEAEGFGRTNYPKQYRGNLRLIVVDEPLAAKTWERIKHTVPVTLPDVRSGISHDDRERGKKWHAVGLNTHWRLSKYYPGDQFQSHVDASYTQDEAHRTMFTVNIYLNGGFAGGATRFYDNPNSLEDSVISSITPEAGRAVVFRQPPEAYYLHDGEQLGDGVKYLLRSDVMYELR